MVHMGHPILGDVTYAGDDDTVSRMCLHSHSLRLNLDMSGASATTVSGGRDREAGAGAGTGEAAGPTELEAGDVDECVNNSPCSLTHGDRRQGHVGGGASSDRENVLALEFVTPDPFVFRDGELQLR